MPTKQAEKHAPKKAAKHALKKGAKKVAGKPDPKKQGKDMLRAYEHLGRVQALVGQLDETERTTVAQLVNLSEQALRARAGKEAAELLRAAEHAAFGALRGEDGPEAELDAGLQEAIVAEVRHLQGRAEEHEAAAEAPKPILRLYKQMALAARRSLKEERFRAALEFSRGAEALTHLHRLAGMEMKLPRAGAPRRLDAPA